MAHEMSWLVENRVILLIYNDTIDDAEMITVNNELEQFFALAQKPVHLISDDRLARKLNISLNSIVKNFSVLRQDGWGYICTIGDDTRTRFFFKTLKALLNMNMHLFPTTEKAFEALCIWDKTLAETQQPALFRNNPQ